MLLVTKTKYMKFQVDFNHHSRDEDLKELGAILNVEDNAFEVEINDLKELEELQQKVIKQTGDINFYLLIDFQAPATIFFDEKA